MDSGLFYTTIQEALKIGSIGRFTTPVTTTKASNFGRTHANSFSTSQKTIKFLLQTQNSESSSGMQFPLIVRTVKNTQVHCVGKTNFLNINEAATRTGVM